jgi:cholesterol transport system auxiliary component
MNKIFVLLLFLLTTSCSIFSPVKIDQQSTYVINKLPSVAVQKSRHATILVAYPETNPLYKTTGIAYTTYPYQIAYFAKNAWAENPGDMIYPLLIQTLQNTHYYRAVLTNSNSAAYDYVLNIQIQKLLQDYSHTPSLVYLTVRAQLIRAASNRVIATKEFAIVESFPERTPYNGVVATNRATESLLRQLAQFCQF